MKPRRATDGAKRDQGGPATYAHGNELGVRLIVREPNGRWRVELDGFETQLILRVDDPAEFVAAGEGAWKLQLRAVRSKRGATLKRGRSRA